MEIDLETGAYLDDVLNMSERIALATEDERLTDVPLADRQRLTALCAVVQNVAHSTWTLRRSGSEEIREILERCRCD